MMWLAAIVLSGTVPAALPAPARIIWIDAAGNEEPAGCALQGSRAWTCDRLPAEPRGLVVVVDASGPLAYIPIGIHDGPGGGIAAWGRIVQIVPGGAAVEDVQDVRVTALKPDRPRYRTLNQRFTAVDDTSTHVLQLSDTTFWITGAPTDQDAFIQVAGPGVATARVPVGTLNQGPPEWPVIQALDAPFALTGRVQTSHGHDAEDVAVELWEPLRPLPAGTLPPAADPLIRCATTVSHGDGTFSFGGLGPGRYHIAAVHPSLGRGDVDVRSLGEPITVSLVPPVTVSGRVLRSYLPVPDARVRFIPDLGALVASANAQNHIAEEVTTAADGRFSLALPPDPTGTVQIIGADSASLRVAVAKKGRDLDISLGDLVLPERRHVSVWLTGGEECALSAVGPLGRLGLAIVQATAAGQVNGFDLPEPGEWGLDATCGGISRDVRPLTVTVSPTGPDPVFEAHILR